MRYLLIFLVLFTNNAYAQFNYREAARKTPAKIVYNRDFDFAALNSGVSLSSLEGEEIYFAKRSNVLNGSRPDSVAPIQGMTANEETNILTLLSREMQHTLNDPFYGTGWKLRGSSIVCDCNSTTYTPRNNYYTYTPQGIPVPYDTFANPQYQTQSGYGKTDMVTAQWDFSDPLKSNMKIEFGFRSSFQHAYSLLSITNVDSSFSEVSPSLSSNYATDNLINAAYFTFSHNIKGFSYELGMRFEQTFFQGTEYNYNNSGHDSSFSYKYPSSHPSAINVLDCFFPSIMLSEKINDKNELQFNITRKINRPGFRQIGPFISNSTPYGYSVGNVALQPEFDNKAEINYNLNITKFTWLSQLYGSFNQQPITSYTYLNPLDSLQIISTFENAKSSLQGGCENTFKITPVKGFDITLDGNVFYTQIRDSTVINGHSALIHNQGLSYVIKGIVSYKLPLAFVVQVNGSYEAPKVIAQGNTLPVYFFDASVSKDLGIATLTLAVSDVMNSRSFGTYYNTPTYIETTIRRRDQRYARLGVTFKFGKMDGSLFRKKQPKKDKDNGGNPEDMGF